MVNHYDTDNLHSSIIRPRPGSSPTTPSPIPPCSVGGGRKAGAAYGADCKHDSSIQDNSPLPNNPPWIELDSPGVVDAGMSDVGVFFFVYDF